MHAKQTAVVFAAILSVGCGLGSQQHHGMTPEEFAAKKARVEAQMNAFDTLLKRNEVSSPYTGPPINESFGKLYDLDFLKGKPISDYSEFFRVADGPTTDPPKGVCSRRFATDESVEFYTWQTNASQMPEDKAPSDRLMITVRDREIVGYCFDAYYLH